MEVYALRQFHIAYALLPYKRNQDVIKILPRKEGNQFVASIVDGWNDKHKVKGNVSGRRVAQFVAKLFPEVFLSWDHNDVSRKAKKVARLVDKEVLKLFPPYCSCAGVFLFNTLLENIIVAVGTINTFLWGGHCWYKPKEIKDYFLPVPPYKSGSRAFFGRSELKRTPFYHVKPDVVVVKPNTPIVVATDGLDDVMNLDELNQFTQSVPKKTPKEFLARLVAEIKRRQAQKDDIALFMYGEL